MAERIPWEYFILRRHIGDGTVDFYVGDTLNKAVPVQNADESQVLGTFGQHGYELCSVQQLRTGDIKYYFKRPANR